MPLAWNPLDADKTVNVTITVDGSPVRYIVTDFNDSGATAVGPDFQNSDGSYRGGRRVKGPREASMTIEISKASQPTPPQFTEFEYRGKDWEIFQSPRQVSSTGAGTFALSLRCLNIPGTVESVTIGAGGTGYPDTGVLTFSGGGGEGAAATFTASAGVITTITITDPGEGYTSAPTVTAPTGTGATLTAVIVDPDA